MNVGPVTATLMDSVKDVELLYLFAKLEKLDGVKARMLAADVMAGDAGRGEILAAIAGEEAKGDDSQKDLFAGEQSDTRSEIHCVSDQEAGLSDAQKVLALIDAMKVIAEKHVGSPQALEMKKLAQATLRYVGAV